MNNQELQNDEIDKLSNENEEHIAKITVTVVASFPIGIRFGRINIKLFILNINLKSMFQMMILIKRT